MQILFYLNIYIRYLLKYLWNVYIINKNSIHFAFMSTYKEVKHYGFRTRLYVSIIFNISILYIIYYFYLIISHGFIVWNQKRYIYWGKDSFYKELILILEF